MYSIVKRGVAFQRREGLLPLLRTSVRLGVNRALSLPVADDISYRLSLRKLSRRIEAENDLNDVLDTVFDYQGYGRYRTIEPMQVRAEFEELVERVDQREPTTVMEIGTANGGTFYSWCRCLDSADTIISLDLPGGQFGGGYSKQQTDFFEEFAPGKELTFIRADSHDDQTFQQVKQAVPENGVDFLFIDGDHRYEGVKQDFEMYGSLVASDGVIGLHDIVDGPTENVGGVPEFWQELKTDLETEEIVAERDQQPGYGIGLVY